MEETVRTATTEYFSVDGKRITEAEYRQISGDNPEATETAEGAKEASEDPSPTKKRR